MSHGTFKDAVVNKRHSENEEDRQEGNKRVVGPNDSDVLRLYRIKRIGRPSHNHVSNPHPPPVHDHDTSRHNNTPMIHALLPFPMHSVFMFHICMSLFLLFGLHGSPIQPL